MQMSELMSSSPHNFPCILYITYWKFSCKSMSPYQNISLFDNFYSFYWPNVDRISPLSHIQWPLPNGVSDKRELRFTGTHFMGQIHCMLIWSDKQDGRSDQGDIFILNHYFCSICSCQKVIFIAVKVRDHTLQKVVPVLAFWTPDVLCSVLAV